MPPEQSYPPPERDTPLPAGGALRRATLVLAVRITIQGHVESDWSARDTLSTDFVSRKLLKESEPWPVLAASHD